MKKLLVLVLLVAVVLMFGTQAYAAKQSFSGFSIDVPTGWVAIEDKAEGSVKISAPDGSESMIIKYVSREAAGPLTFAESVAFDFGGKPIDIGEGEYEFVLSDGTKARTRLVESWGVFMKSRGGFDRLIALLDTWSF
jgi:hypothetical protein